MVELLGYVGLFFFAALALWLIIDWFEGGSRDD